MDNVVSEVLIWGGDWEILIDGICELAQKLKHVYGEKCHIIYGEKAMHDEIILDKALGYKPPKTALEVEDWIKAKL